MWGPPHLQHWSGPLELFPLQFSFTDPLYLPEVFPPNGFSSIQIEYCNSYLHLSWIILHLKLLLDPKNPSFSLLSSLYLTIKCRRFSFPKFISRVIPMVPSSFPFLRRWTCISTGNPSSSHSAALTAFWSWCTSSKIYLFSINLLNFAIWQHSIDVALPGL